jgi:hypothetical protein
MEQQEISFYLLLKKYFLFHLRLKKRAMSSGTNRIQAEGVIKNIIREIVQECASRGEGLFYHFSRFSIYK